MIQLARPSRGHVTQFYGNTQPDGMPHAGQDYAYTNGTEIFPEVYAAADGVVQFAGDSRNLGWPNPWYVNPDFNRADNWDSSAGNLIAIRHAQFSADTGYGHLEKCFVKAGDTVKAGQVIGIAGETGNSRGKHLHFFLMFHPFHYNTSTYGCSDPNPYLTGSLSYAGTITPQEDELAAEDVDKIVKLVQEMHDVTRTHLINKTQDQHDVTRQFLSDRTKDATLAVLGGVQAEEAVTRAYVADTTQAQQDVTRQYLSDRISETGPAELAELVPAEIAQQVIDALSARLAGGPHE